MTQTLSKNIFVTSGQKDLPHYALTSVSEIQLLSPLVEYFCAMRSI